MIGYFGEYLTPWLHMLIFMITLLGSEAITSYIQLWYHILVVVQMNEILNK